jgi:hypothetical protein
MDNLLLAGRRSNKKKNNSKKKPTSKRIQSTSSFTIPQQNFESDDDNDNISNETFSREEEEEQSPPPFQPHNHSQMNHDDNDEEIEFEEPLDLNVTNEATLILSDKKNWGKRDCIFCLQSVRFYEEGQPRPTQYPKISETTMKKIEDMVIESRRQNNFLSNGSKVISYYLNGNILAHYNNLISPNTNTKKFPEVTALAVYKHFTSPDHINSVYNIINEEVDNLTLLTTHMYKNGIVTKNRKNGKISYNLELIDKYNNLLKTKCALLKQSLMDDISGNGSNGGISKQKRYK